MTRLRYAAFSAVVLLTVLPVLTFSPTPVHSYSSGPPPFFSGPEQICNACHGGTSANPPNTGDGSVTITAPTKFAPGDTITVTVAVDNTTPQAGENTKRQGFQLSARIPDSGSPLEHAGSFDLGGSDLVQLASDDFVTHTTAGSADSVWTFFWIAPAEDVPAEVVLYVAGNASNSNFAPDDGDLIYTATHTLTLKGVANEPEALPLALQLGAVYPNPLQGSAQATFTLEAPAVVTATLRDGRGRTVRVLEQGVRAAGDHPLAIDASGLAPGVYFLTVSTPEGTQTRPLSVIR